MTQIRDRKLWVYDIETLKSCFTYSAINIDTQERVQYVIHKDRNDIVNLCDHLCKCNGQIGFNNIGFDYPVIHELMSHYSNDLTFDITRSIKDFIDLIYNKAQEIINSQNNIIGYNNLIIPQSKRYINQLDLFKIWHFDNKARRQSLKGLEIAMNYPNVMDMNIDHKRDDIRLDEIDSILEYNMNDVLATYEFYKKSIDKINLRKDLKKEYNLDCINYSDSKIGESLVLKLYCNKTNQDEYDVKKLRTNRDKIDLSKCIFDYIKLNTPEFNKILNAFKSKTITETKGALEESVVYKGFKYDFGLGGIHGCVKPGIYESNSDYLIIDADVALI